MEIPRYPDRRQLVLDNKLLLDKIFVDLQPRISELTFANLYLFRAVHDYQLTMVGDSLVLFGKGYGDEPYFLPPLNGNVESAVTKLLNEEFTIYGADEHFVTDYLLDKNLEIVEDRDSFDYLYLRRELAELPGNRFHKKKNRINYLVNRHAFSIEPYGEGNLQGCLELLAEWRRVRVEVETDSKDHEADATAEALLNARLLGLEGVVALVEGKVKAFALGEQLNRDTSACLFEKADPFLDGLYQLIDREFNRLLFTECTYVNREQDLGIMNLRQSKLSYHPVEMIKKYRARRSGLKKQLLWHV